MLRKSRTAIFALAIAGIVFFGPTARADNFKFSFTNTLGGVPGTVTGEILGLTNNSTSAATQVIIETFPAALNPSFFPPINATLWSIQIENSFTEAAGGVVSGGFEAQMPGITFGFSDLAIDSSGYNVLYLECHCGLGGREVADGGGLAAANIDPLGSSSVPEPTSVILLLTMLLAITFVQRKRIVRG